MTSPERAGGPASGDRPVAAEVEKLVSRGDLIGLGALADEQRRRVRGGRVTFVRVQVMASAGSSGDLAVLPAAGELRIAADVSTRREAMVVTERAVVAAGSVPVTGFSLTQLAALCDDDPVEVKRLLVDLRAAGLSMVAEAQMDAPRVRDWLETSGEAGIDVARLTVSGAGGHDGVQSAREVSAWGTTLAHVHAFAPLPRGTNSRPTTGFSDVRRVALARLLVDNIDSIQVDWSTHGPKLAQVALLFGADDIDSVSPVDSLEQGTRRAPLEEVRRNIEAAGLTPVERNGRFEIYDV